jgi:hypothetical protein
VTTRKGEKIDAFRTHRALIRRLKVAGNILKRLVHASLLYGLDFLLLEGVCELLCIHGAEGVYPDYLDMLELRDNGSCAIGLHRG